MFPVNVSLKCSGAEDIPMVPNMIIIIVMMAIAPWIINLTLDNLPCACLGYEQFDSHPVRHSISWVVRSFPGMWCGLAGFAGVVGYTWACFGGTDPVLCGIVALGAILLAFVLTCNGDPESGDPTEKRLTWAHVRAAALAFLYLMTTATLTVYFFSQSEEKYGGRAIAAYIMYIVAIMSFLGMGITILMSEWGDATSVFEWIYGTSWVIIIALIPGRIGTVE